MALRSECELCGDEVTARNGEGLLSKEKSHRRSCHPGFTDAEEVPDSELPTGLLERSGSDG